MADVVIPVDTLEPTSKFFVLENIPLDNSYSDTLTFSDATAQYNYFSSHIKKNISNMANNIKFHSGTVRFPANANSIHNCNYCMFQIQNYNRWHYAFITEITFINQNVCEVTYELDVMQTFLFNFKLKQCMVLREHVKNDVAGRYLESENIEHGDYVTYSSTRSHQFDEMGVLAFIKPNDTKKGLERMTNNVYQGLQCEYYPAYYEEGEDKGTVPALRELLAEHNNDDGIVSLNMFPKSFWKDKPLDLTGDNDELQGITIHSSVTKQYMAFGGYTPKNKKLWTYPYYMFYISNTQGSTIPIKIERARSQGIKFDISCPINSNPQAILTMQDYDYIDDDVEHSITLSGFPMCSWITDTYKAWLAQNASSLAIGGISSAFATVGGAVTGNAPAIIGGLSGIGGLVGNVYSHSIAPDVSHGSTTSNAMYGQRKLDFYFGYKGIQEEYARSIDEFFTMYGYAINRVKTPQYMSRRNHNFVRTNDCKCGGYVPMQYLSKIKAIFNAGITFWHNPDTFGNYDADNSEV